MRKVIFFKDAEKRTEYNADQSKIAIPVGISFHVLGKPEMKNKKFKLIGRLVNETDHKQEIFVFPVGGLNPFNLTLRGQSVSMKHFEGPYQVPPPPMVISVPPETEIEFNAFLRLDNYEYSGVKEAELRWKFHFLTGKSPEGSFKVTIPET